MDTRTGIKSLIYKIKKKRKGDIYSVILSHTIILCYNRYCLYVIDKYRDFSLEYFGYCLQFIFATCLTFIAVFLIHCAT